MFADLEFEKDEKSVEIVEIRWSVKSRRERYNYFITHTTRTLRKHTKYKRNGKRKKRKSKCRRDNFENTKT